MRATEILPHLFVGRLQDARSENLLMERGFTHILNVMESSKFYENSKIVRSHVPISDFGDTDLAPVFANCADFIEEAYNKEGKVLLHCGRGQNRSPTVAVSYLLLKKGLNLKQAFFHVRERRIQFAPHENYLKALQELDNELFGEVSLTEEGEPLSIQAITRDIVSKTK